MPRRRRDAPALARMILREDTPLRIEFKFAGQSDPLDPIVIYDDKAINEAWGRAGRALDELVTQAGGHAESVQDLWEPLRVLLAAGRELGQRLTDLDNDKWNRVQRAFTEARALGWPVFEWNNIPVVDVVAYENTFPIELLPVFLPPDGRPITRIENDLDLMRMAERFLGFTAVVRRVAPERELEPATLPNDPALPIQLFRYREVEWDGSTPTTGPGVGFAQEEAFLASLPEVIVDGPWPTDETEADVKERVLDALFDARKRLTSVTDEHPAAALAHFVCHCTTTNRHIEKFELLLSTARGESRKVLWGHITDGYSERGELTYPDQPGQPDRAAIIFNACGASAIDPMSSLSFQRWFLKNRHPAFLGTHAKIPDQIAADFAELLYSFLLGKFSLGEAVLLARRQLLLGAKSPLGILYVLHGNDRLEVEVERPHALPKGFQ
jgi:hypothetical protein